MPYPEAMTAAAAGKIYAADPVERPRSLLNSRLADIGNRVSALANQTRMIAERLYGPVALDPMPDPAPGTSGQIGEAHGQINAINALLEQFCMLLNEMEKRSAD